MERLDTIAPGGGAADAEEEPVHGTRWFGSLGSILFLLLLTWAAAIASFPLNDNSFFTHLATGRLILDEGTVPSTDPYTFTAQGEPWTVQSWLASIAYAGFERLAGDVGLRILLLAVFLCAMAVVWRLSRPAESVIVRLLLLAVALAVVTDLWSERPYMIGVIGLGLVWLALDDGSVRPWMLVPLLWVWVNSHGSFPLALALVVSYLVGVAVDRRAAGEPLAISPDHRKVAGATFLGVLLGAVSPVGPKLLWFPLTAMSKSDVFAEILEWRPPAYRSIAERAFLVFVIVTMVLLLRRRAWRLALPAVLFAAAGLYAQRNIVMATMVLVAVAAASAPSMGSLRTHLRPRTGPIAAGVVALLLVAVGSVTLVTPVDGFGGYPVHAVAWQSTQQLSGRTIAEIPTGNLLEVLDGATGEVFVDDRVDMLPEAVFDDYLVLRRGRPGWEQVLDRYDAGVVVWDRAEPLAALLATSKDWSVVFSSVRWVVAVPRQQRS